MSKPKLTKWQSMRDTPPTVPGIYNVSCRSRNQTGLWYAHFDGVNWSVWETIERAKGWRNLCEIAQTNLFRTRGEFSYRGAATWRGLAHPPKAKP